MIAMLIGYEAISRIFAPVPIHFAEAIPIACLGLAVNVASALLLGFGDHGHAHGHGHSHGHGTAHAGHDHDESQRIATRAGTVVLEVFEDGVPPRFRLRARSRAAVTMQTATVETLRPTAHVSCSPWPITAAIWNRSRRSPNRMPSRRMSVSGMRCRPFSSKSTSTRKAAQLVTTTCGRRWST